MPKYKKHTKQKLNRANYCFTISSDLLLIKFDVDIEHNNLKNSYIKNNQKQLLERWKVYFLKYKCLILV